MKITHQPLIDLEYTEYITNVEPNRGITYAFIRKSDKKIHTFTFVESATLDDIYKGITPTIKVRDFIENGGSIIPDYYNYTVSEEDMLLGKEKYKTTNGRILTDDEIKELYYCDKEFGPKVVDLLNEFGFTVSSYTPATKSVTGYVAYQETRFNFDGVLTLYICSLLKELKELREKVK